MTNRRWPGEFPLLPDGGVEEGLTVLSMSGAIEGRTTGSRRPCISIGCPGWFIGVRWETGQMLYPCSEGWTYDPEARVVRITGGQDELSARAPTLPGAPVPPRDSWPERRTLNGKGWRARPA